MILGLGYMRDSAPVIFYGKKLRRSHRMNWNILVHGIYIRYMHGICVLCLGFNYNFDSYSEIMNYNLKVKT